MSEVQDAAVGRPAHQSADPALGTADASRDRLAFLAEASRCLAGSLDYEATLTTVAGMSLPYLDAWCIVDLLTGVGGIRRLAVLHPDAKKQEIARELHLRYPPLPDDRFGAPRVMRSARPEIIFDVVDDALTSVARDEKHLELLRALGTKAYVIVPMVAHGRTLGAMTFITADAGRRFGDIDVMMAEDVARRAAMAVDNARLHAEALAARAVAEDALAEAEAANEGLREARDAAEAAFKVRSDFLASMTHEVRTPLNAIVGYMGLLELGVAGDLTETQRLYVERVRDSSHHLLRLVDDVLDLSKTEAGRLGMATDVVLAADTARAALATLRPQAAGKLVTLVDESAEPRGLHYVGDEHRVRQILINLLANAIKFTAPGGRVVLECAREAGRDETAPDVRQRILFRVRDTGQGVSAREADVIFEPFVQGEAGLTRAHSGIGLGLSISRRLARLMGGDVVLERTTDDGSTGAAFILQMPAASSDPDAEGDLPSEGAPGASGAPDAVAVPHRTPAERSAARRGLGAAAEALLYQIGPAVEEFVRRARADAGLSITDEMTDVEIADHLATLLTDLANSLAVLGEAGGEPTDQLRDGSKIQRLIGELHGAQRHRLGWTEAQLVREGQLLREVCEAAIARAVASNEQAVEAATMALARLLQERMRAGLSGFRVAAGTESSVSTGAPHRNERPQPVVAQIEPAPDE